MDNAAVEISGSPPVEADNIVLMRGVGWADYQRLLAMRGEHSVPRLTYLEGALELMSPSQMHESIKSMLGRLVEAWCVEHKIEITPYGSWTLESKETLRGVEPDECYVLGDNPDATICDLAIEVIWTSGNIDKLAVYHKLGVQEVWVWKEGSMQIYAHTSAGYEKRSTSDLLVGIDLAVLLEFIDSRPMTRAVREYRATMRSQ